MAQIDMAKVATSWDGTCGPTTMKKCATGCCSIYGNCGTSTEHCSGGCQHAFGTGCIGPDVAASWQDAAANGVYDKDAGAQYYFDPNQRLFWTWDTPEIVARKFKDIVATYGLGGVMAWSLGEDTYDWSHVRAIAAGVKALGDANSEYMSSEGGNPKPEQVQEVQQPQNPESEYWIQVDPPMGEYTTHVEQTADETPVEATDYYQETEYQGSSNPSYDSSATEDASQY